MRVILAAVDLGAGAPHVLAGAATLARWSNAALHVLHVSETVSPNAVASQAAQAALNKERAQLAQLVERCCDRHVDAQEVLPGKPAETISACARARRADVIVLGPNTAAELAVLVFGTTAERVVSAAKVPCLIVRASLPQTLTTIAVAIDFSPASVAAAEISARWLRTFGESAAQTKLHLLHVGWPMDRLADPELEDRTLQPKLRELAQRLSAAGALAIETHVIWWNPPGAAIARWAEEQSCELLVLGMTGRNAARALLLGSVAASVARQAPCALALVPPPRS